MHRRNKKLSRLLALLLSLAMVLSLVPGIAMADADGEEKSADPAEVMTSPSAGDQDPENEPVTIAEIVVQGTDPNGLTWALDDSGTFTISGTGEMYDAYSGGIYDSSLREKYEWYSYCDDIINLVVETGVTSVAHFAFYGYSNLESVKLADTVTYLGGYCFYQCSSLKNVDFGEGMTSIDNRCFRECTALESIELPDTVTSIGDYCFESCSSLKNVDLGKEMISLGEYCFGNCTALESIDLPDTLTTLNNYCFRGCSSLKSIVIPSGVTTLPMECFRDCTSLKYVEIPDTVTSIVQQCFRGCSSLESITLPSGLTQLTESLFQSCSSLKSIVIPSGVTRICQSCFQYCYSLGNVEIQGDNVTLEGRCFNLSSGNLLKVIFDGDPPILSSNSYGGATSAFQSMTVEIYYPCSNSAWEAFDKSSTLGGGKITYEIYHTWGDVIYFLWSEDNKECTAFRTCEYCKETETKNAYVSDQVTVEPTCVEPGEMLCTAIATFDGVQYANQKTVEIDPTGEHTWGEVTFVWSDDYSSATASRSCSVCHETETVNADVIYEVTVKPTDTESGEGAYTAKATFDDGTVTTSDPVTVTIPALDVDKTGLDDEIADAEKLNQDDYTEESWAELQKALENAEAVTSDPYASQEEVDAAAEAVKEAIGNLIKTSDTPTPGTTGPGPEEVNNGFIQENGEWHYYDNGTRFTGSDIKQDTKKAIDGTDGWYYIENGKVNFDYTRVSNFSNAYGWWYVKNGKVDFSKTGIEQNNYGWWRIVGGKVDFSCNSVEQNDYGWWYVTGGQVRFDYTGVADYANAYGWWYISGGQVDFSKTGIEPNSYGWWRVVNGQVEFSCNSVEQNDYGWWYVTGGQVQFGYTGVANYANAYGWWYIRDGKVDFSYTGTASNNYGTWNVVNGKVVF